MTYQNGEVSSFKNAGELKPLLVSLGAFEVTEKGRVAVSNCEICVLGSQNVIIPSNTSVNKHVIFG